jgi:hypothetical protein
MSPVTSKSKSLSKISQQQDSLRFPRAPGGRTIRAFSD